MQYNYHQLTIRKLHVCHVCIRLHVAMVESHARDGPSKWCQIPVARRWSKAHPTKSRCLPLAVDEGYGLYRSTVNTIFYSWCSSFWRHTIDLESWWIKGCWCCIPLRTARICFVQGSIQPDQTRALQDPMNHLLVWIPGSLIKTELRKATLASCS